jgi:hypothetical protein
MTGGFAPGLVTSPVFDASSQSRKRSADEVPLAQEMANWP